MSRPPLAFMRLKRLFDEGAELTLPEMAMRLGISERHARRVLHELIDGGLPLVHRREGRRKVYFLPEGQRETTLQQISLTEEEVLALTVAVEAARATLAATPLGAPLEHAFSKLLHELAPNVYSFSLEELPSHWHFGSPGIIPINAEIFHTLSRAIEEKRTVLIDYHTASNNTVSRNRRIDPLMFGMPGGSWLVVAWCHRRRAIRDFAIAGIRAIRPTDTFFAPPDGFDPELYFRDRFGSLAGEVLTVRLLVEADRAPYFERKVYHPTQQIERHLEDGRIIVSFEAAGLEALRAFCLSWGSGVKVLDPPELVARMQEESRALARHYPGE
ncbi:WYL domain-containing protein [Rhodocaloribacter litoris]|uniref:helix-turn-helix transcriptional regulator n=1 Tax=Rhodocaloribacter litoris TaxID=2558931 RepID=UPI00141D9DCA|nr:WYL domain-containing protein [Rhodocaloribacter litoris]QXD16406.1 WYL domain-containing protein [Rhodocaloribacter litoris]